MGFLSVECSKGPPTERFVLARRWHVMWIKDIGRFERFSRLNEL